MDDKKFDGTPKEVYPMLTKIIAAIYLISCSAPSYFMEVEMTPVLLLLNTITAFLVALAFFCFSILKGDKEKDEYPFVQFGAYTLVIMCNFFSILQRIWRIGKIY